MCSNIKREEYKENSRAEPLLGLLSRGAASAGAAVSLRNRQCHAPLRQLPERGVAPAAARRGPAASGPSPRWRWPGGCGGRRRGRAQEAPSCERRGGPAGARSELHRSPPRRSAVLQPAAVSPPAPAAEVSWWPGQGEQETPGPLQQGPLPQKP